MLKIVQSLVKDLKFKPFGQFYTEYIMKVQDSNIEHEVKQMLRKTDIATLGYVIEHEFNDFKI